jgi:hypothetical protein
MHRTSRSSFVGSVCALWTQLCSSSSCAGQILLWFLFFPMSISHPGLDSFWHRYPHEQVRRSALGSACALDGCRCWISLPAPQFFSFRTAQILYPLGFSLSRFLVCVFWSPREGLRPLLILFRRRRSDLGQLRFSLGLPLDCSCSWVKSTSQL